MAQTIKLKRSAIAGRIPTISDLELGEVAINTYDGKMYIKKTVEGTESIVEIGGNAEGESTPFTEYSYTATAGQTVFTGADDNQLSLNLDKAVTSVTLNGSYLDPQTGYSISTDGSTLTLTSSASVDDVLKIVALNKVMFKGELLVDALQLEADESNAGQIQWDSEKHTASLTMGNGVTQQIGEEIYYPKNTRNMTGSTIPNGTPVRLAGGAGDDSYIAPAIADGSIRHEYYIGLTTEDIADGDYGRVVYFGSINDVNTSSFSKGDLLYVSDTTAGSFTTTKPESPSHAVLAALVTKVGTTDGRLFVRLQPSFEAAEVGYNNQVSGLTSTNVKGALDELQQNKASVDLLSSSINLFPTTAASDIANHNRLVTDKLDPDYDTTAVDVATGPISTSETLVGQLISDANLVEGSIAGITVTILGNIDKTAGNFLQGAHFYFKMFRRETDGTEHEMGESGHTRAIYTTDGYEQFSSSLYINDGSISTFSTTDRLVIRFYGISTSGSPEYNFQFGGLTPIRALVPVPVLVIPSRSAEETPVDTADFNGVLTGQDSNVQAALDTLDNHNHDTQYAPLSNYNNTNWDTAYGWGDHSVEGYLTSFTETDPTVPSHVKAITTGDISNWDTAHGWGDHASAGYLTSFTETDPTVPSHVKAISTSDVANWDTAYGWGDHSVEGYLTSVSWSEVTNKPTEFPPVSHTHPYVPLAGGTMTGDLTMGGSSKIHLDSPGQEITFGRSPGQVGYIRQDVAGQLQIGSDNDIAFFETDADEEKVLIAANTGNITAVGSITAASFSGDLNYNDITNPPVIDNSVDYLNSASFDTGNGLLTLSGVGRAGATVDLDGRYPLSSSNQSLSSDENTFYSEGNVLKLKRGNGDIDSVDISPYLDDTNLARITSGTLNSSGIATFNRDDATTFTVDMSILLDNTNLSRIVSAAWNTSNGVLTLTRNDSSTVSVDLDNRYLTSETDTLQSVTNRGNTTTQTMVISGSSAGGFEFRTADSWESWARHTHSISTGGGTHLFGLGGYGDSGTTLGFAYLGKSYQDMNIRMYPDGETQLYYDNSQKLATTATGVDVTGTVTAEAIKDAYVRGTRNGGQGGAGDTQNYLKLGNIFIKGSEGAEIRILGTENYSAGNPVSGVTYIRLRANNATNTVDGFFYGETKGRNTATNVAYKHTADNRFDIYVKTGRFSPSSFWVDTDGEWTSDYQDTGSTALPSGAVELDSKRIFTIGGTKRISMETNGDVHFYENTGSTPKMTWDSSAETLKIGSYLWLNHDGTQSDIQTYNSTPLRINKIGNNVLICEDDGLVGIGTSSPDSMLHVRKNQQADTAIEVSNLGTPSASTTSSFIVSEVEGFPKGWFRRYRDGTGRTSIGYEGNFTIESTNGSERARIDSSGNLLVGTTDTTLYNSTSSGGILLDPSGPSTFARNGTNPCLQLNKTNSDGPALTLRKSGAEVGSIGVHNNVAPYFARPSVGGIRIGGQAVEPSDANGAGSNNSLDLGTSVVKWKDLYLSGGLRGDTLKFSNNAGLERMRIDSAGNLMVGKTSAPVSVVGHTLFDNGQSNHTADSNVVTRFNRLSTDGEILSLRKDGSTVGSIGVVGGNELYIGSGTDFVKFGFGSIDPSNSSGANNDNAIDLGKATSRFKHLYLSGYSRADMGYRVGSTTVIDSSRNIVNIANITASGLLTATTKSFTIDHPTKEGHKLRYGSLEGPENGVYVRGRLKDENVIELPEVWKGLVHEDSITVNLTPIGKGQDIWVEDFDNTQVVVGGKNVNCFYTIFAERKDVEKLVTEFKEFE